MSESVWLSLWQKNYNNETVISKNVMALSKQTYKGDTYLPWALLVGALYQQDPEAKIEKCMNDDGGFVFTDLCTITTVKEGVETSQTVLSHFVKIKLTFMGKDFEEAYPIQDNDYSASKVYDQNKVNKAQQRCLARVISMATGIGWRIYEQTEAQFEDDKKPVPPTPAVSEPAKVTKGEAKTAVDSIVDVLLSNKDNEKVINLLSSYNTVLKSKYKDASGNPLVLDPSTDSDEVLKEKISVIDNPDKLLKGFLKVVS